MHSYCVSFQCGFSVVRATQPIEHLQLATAEDFFDDELVHVQGVSDGTKPETILQLASCMSAFHCMRFVFYFVSDSVLCEGIDTLCDAIKAVAHCFTQDALAEFEQRDVTASPDDDDNVAPEDIARRLVEDVMRAGDKLFNDVTGGLQNLHNPSQALEHLLLLLDAGQHAPVANDVTGQVATMERLFASDIASQLLASCVQQNVSSRFEFARDLLLFLVFCAECKTQVSSH